MVRSEFNASAAALAEFLFAIAESVDRDSKVLIVDPVLRAETMVPARLLLSLCAESRDDRRYGSTTGRPWSRSPNDVSVHGTGSRLGHYLRQRASRDADSLKKKNPAGVSRRDKWVNCNINTWMIQMGTTKSSLTFGVVGID